MNVLPPPPVWLNCIEVDVEMGQKRKWDACIAAYKEFAKSEARKVDTSRDCEMVNVRKLQCWVALFRANTARIVNKM
jgi:hypothetical protein